MRTDPQSALRRVAGAAQRAAFRVRLNETLERSLRLLPLPLLYGVAALTVIKVARPGQLVERGAIAIGAALLSAWCVYAALVWFRRRPRHYGALALDRHHALSDRISSALTFSELPEAERSPLMRAAIADALSRAGDLVPRRAVPLRLPPELPVALLLAAGLAGIALLEVRTERVIPPARTIEPLVMTSDDLDLFRELGRDLADKSKDPEASAAAARFNQVIEDVAQRRLDRSEVFRRLEEIERLLARGAEADKEALEQGLAGLARELEQADLSKPVATHLKQQQLADAEKAMKELAEKLSRAKDKPNRQELEKLRRALDAASKASAERAKAIEQKRAELEQQKKRLLNKQRDAGAVSPQDQAELDKRDRQLERLNREKDQASRAQRQLSEIDRALAEAARDLMQELNKSAQDLEQAAQDLNRMQQKQMTQQEKEQLRQRLQELRELLRQQGQGGQQRMARMQRFGERARGQQGQGQGQQGQGQGQQGQEQQGQEQQGQGQKGQGQQGQGPDGELLVLGQGGDKLVLMPGMQGSGQQGEQPGGGGKEPGGKSYGAGHDPNLTGERSELQGSTKDVSAAAQDTGEGAASSQVIYGAAERGFTGRGYQKVYTDYKTVAEQVMNEDEIPAGYRFYVQRYFQLIRPRE